MTTDIKIVKVKVSALKPADYNPRKWSDRALKDIKDSITTFGMVDPIIANGAPGRKNIVIGGHLRLKAAKDLGYTEVPVIYITLLDIEKEKELNLRLNKNIGEWDWSLLSEFDRNFLGMIGFSEEDLTIGFGLNNIVRTVFDEDRLNVLTVLPPESPTLKERIEIHFDSIEDYKKVKKAFDDGHLNTEMVLKII